MWGAAAVAAALAWGAKLLVGVERPIVGGLAVLASFGVAYLAVTIGMGLPEARRLVGRVSGRLVRGHGGAR